MLLSVAGVGVARAEVPVCDLSNGEWQMWRGVTDAEKEYPLREVIKVWDFNRNEMLTAPFPPQKIELLKNGGVVICNLVPEDGVSIVVPNGFNTEEAHDTLPPWERAWLRSKTGARFPIIGPIALDITKMSKGNTALLVEETNTHTLQAGGKSLVLSKESMNVLLQVPQNEVVIPPHQPVLDFRRNVKDVVDKPKVKGDTFCGDNCGYYAVGMLVVGIVVTTAYQDSKNRDRGPPATGAPNGPTNPAGALFIFGK